MHARAQLQPPPKPGWRLLRTAAPALACLAALLLAAAPAFAQGFMADISPKEFTLAPGETATGEITVSSTAAEAVELRVYLSQPVRGAVAQESYAYSDEPGAEPRSAMAWISFTPEQFTLAPDGEQLVSFEIRVPADAGLSGSYFATLFVSNATAAETVLAQSPEGGVGMGINMLFRFATFISVTIAGTATSGLEFTALNVAPQGAWFDVQAELRNAGNSVGRPRCWCELRDTAGELRYAGEAGATYVLPESGRLVKYEIREPLPEGEYLLMVIADYGAPKLVAAQGRLRIDAAMAQAMQQAYAAELAAAAAAPTSEGTEQPPSELPPELDEAAEESGAAEEQP